ncbi:MAG: hypothetical protein EOM23_04715 [Candidatus Moranbacteria bacterium]|nr:hypothetical protein [Candidatus Moranbacteria bacterium]
MKKIVKECLDKYVGGNKYFHELDELIKYDDEILQEILNNVYSLKAVLILSGTFGKQMVNYIKKTSQNDFDYILLVGSPRKMEKVIIQETKLQNNYTTGVFLDDTFFSGRTFFYSKGYVESEFDIFVSSAFVAYDGNKHKIDYLNSLYRYYDYHDINGKPL